MRRDQTIFVIHDADGTLDEAYDTLERAVAAADTWQRRFGVTCFVAECRVVSTKVYSTAQKERRA